MRRITTAALAFVLLFTIADRVVAQTGRDLFQQALVKERANGDLRGAIAIYERIVREFTADRPLTANTLVQLGECYEKLGSTEAERAYQRVVSEFADQGDFVAQARERLAALRPAGGRAPSARRLLTSRDPADVVIGNPGTTVPSPDGRRVAYAQTERQDAGVYVRDLASGEVQQVATREPRANQRNFSVVWSRDGRQLAFVQTDSGSAVTTIRIFNLGSRETVPIPGLDARGLYLLEWSPDGRHLLCNHTGRNTLELVSIDDASMTTLSDSIWSGQRASFSPDGRFVAFARGRYGHESLYTQSLSGGPRTRIVDSQEGAYLHPLWSPDGGAIAYWREEGLWIVPVSDGAASGPPRMGYRTDIPRWPVAWTEAGYFFAYVAQSDVPHQVSVNPTTGQLEHASPTELPAYPNGLMDFTWAPDMRRVVFSRWGGGVSVFATDTRTLTSLDLGGDRANQAWWSPDGREVVYYTGDVPTLTGQLKAIDLSTGRIRTLFPPMLGWDFSLSADGREMSFMRAASRGSPCEVVVAKTDQLEGLAVAAGTDSDGSRVNCAVLPAMSPRGEQVLFVRQNAGGGQRSNDDASALWLVGSDGTGARRLATARAIDNARWDPSGRFIALTAREGSTTFVVRVLEASTGVERDRMVLPSGQRWGLTDWSPDGRLIGLHGVANWWEYWVVQGLERGRQ